MSADVTAAIRDHLEADAGVSGITTRIRRSWARSADALPYVVVWGGVDEPVHHMTAASSMSMRTFDIDCMASSRGGAHQLSELVREALDGRLSAAMGDDSLVVDSVVFLAKTFHDERPTNASQIGIFRDSWECRATYRQSVPTPV